MEEIIKLTRDLIRFKTIQSQPAQIQQCPSFIEDYLKTCGVQYRRLDHSDIPSIIIMPQSKVAPILLMSPIDVVDGPDDLFQPRIKYKALYDLLDAFIDRSKPPMPKA